MSVSEAVHVTFIGLVTKMSAAIAILIGVHVDIYHAPIPRLISMLRSKNQTNATKAITTEPTLTTTR
ncbi:MAG: hypothetical protein NPIRA05_10830 [Nitrospirales bacterium]|nr:MAG: hypothetical protein NPIRA05_10830 [Nitrospirales bacterium]